MAYRAPHPGTTVTTRRWCVGVLAVVLVGVACPAVAEGPELLRNGSLDVDANADRMPDRWRFALQKGQPEWIYDPQAGTDDSGAVAIRSALTLQRRERADAAGQVLRRWLDRVDISRLRTNQSMQGNWSGHSVDEDGLQALSGSFGLDVGIGFDDYDRFRREVAEQIIALGE